MKKIIIENYDISLTKLDKKILVISDIHYTSIKDRKVLEKILNKLNNYTCDYILMPGDLIDTSKILDEDIFIDFLTKLGNIAKVIISLGNHDVSVRKNGHKVYYFNDELFSKIKRIKNVYILDNEIYKDGNIRFIGLTLPLDYYSYHENRNYFKRFTNNTFKSITNKTYNILLCHSPIFFEDEQMIKEVSLLDNINLIVSGHIHAGLVPRCLRKKLKGKGIVNPFHKFWPKRCYGFYSVADKKIIITPGVTKISAGNKFLIHFNFLFDIEMTEINLK